MLRSFGVVRVPIEKSVPTVDRYVISVKLLKATPPTGASTVATSRGHCIGMCAQTALSGTGATFPVGKKIRQGVPQSNML